jgi:hypothetical protein
MNLPGSPGGLFNANLIKGIKMDAKCYIYLVGFMVFTAVMLWAVNDALNCI